MDDLIKKEMVIDILQELYIPNPVSPINVAWDNVIDVAKRRINELPSIHEKGRWVKQADNSEFCSICSYLIPSEEMRTPHCPWCGADMRGEENAER